MQTSRGKKSNHKYKIETKPTLWDVMLSSGEYSDYSEDHHYIRANDRDEAWYLFKQYWDEKAEDYRPCLVLMDIDGRELEKYAPYPYKPLYDGDNGTNWNFDADYGDAQRCQLKQLEVIEFRS